MLMIVIVIDPYFIYFESQYELLYIYIYLYIIENFLIYIYFINLINSKKKYC